MPAVHVASFRVRHYECDAYGHLNNANYVRYMQETAFDASAAVGYDKARYEAMGYLWLARETEIEYLQPLAYRDAVEVKTWVGDFRRVRSRRFYEFYKSGELAARANTDWVYIEAASERPSAVPPEMVSAFVPEGVTDTSQPRERFPTLPTPPPEVFTLRRRVEWRDIDTAGHVNNAVYFNYIEDCAMQVARAYDWPLSRSDAEGFAAVTRQHHIEYRYPGFLDDELDIATWVALKGRTIAERYYTITRPRDNTLLAQAISRLVCIDLKTRKPMRIPEEYRAAFAPNIVESIDVKH